MSNDMNNPSVHFEDVLKKAIDNPSRRNILRGGLGLSALSFLGLAGCGGDTFVNAEAKPANALNFAATPLNQTFDGVSVANGYKVEMLYKLGDPINAATLAYKNDGSETSSSFDFRAGDHHDGMYFFGMGSNNKWNETVSDKGVLCINHEAITPLFLHANGPTPPTGSRTMPDEVQKEFRLHGVSVVEVNKVNGAFQVNLASQLNRRITTLTPMDIAGPLRGHDLLKTKYSPNGFMTRGTVNNCASGYTPWGTYLTCEENYAGYFKRTNTAGRTANELASEARNGLTSTSGRERWSSIVDNTTDDYARWDITVTGASATDDYRNAGNTYGFNVEIDPFASGSTPKKRTAMGRFAHEGAWVAPVSVGKPVVFYMGCDSEGEYIYKFVSTETWRASDINGGLSAGDRYLDSGKLFVAKFNENFTGQWLELTVPLTGTVAAPSSNTFTFGDASDPFLNTRLCADKVGATKMDRPEWGAVNPANGEVYFTLTNSRSKRPVADTNASNPRSYTDNASGTGSTAGNWNGHIIRWRENNSNPAATTFDWDIYVFGAETDDLNNANVNLSGLTAENYLSSPDGLWFSEKTGIMYIQTDDGQFTNEADGSGTTCMLLAAIPGQVGDGSSVAVVNTVGAATQTVTTRVGKVGQLKRLLTGPLDCEITGITETHDGKALFINIQHPGENTTLANIASPISSWPYSNTGSGNPTSTSTKSARPRSATIVLTRIDGGVIGTDFTLS